MRKVSTEFYDCTKVMNMKDLDGKEPAIIMISGNRTAGKTYSIKRFLINYFLDTGRKFIVLVRFGSQLKGIADTFFKDLEEIEDNLQGKVMTEKRIVQNSINQLDLDGVHCGYVVCLNNADAVKGNSTLFVDVDYIFLDEFQSESDKYCPDEIQKFESICLSVARGGGKHVRPIKAILTSNTVTVLNPYYYTFQVAPRLRKDTRFLRGKGWILELCNIETASRAIKDSALGRAFANSEYMQFSTDNKYLNDSDTFLAAPTGNGRQICLIKYENKVYGLWVYGDMYYITDKVDKGSDYIMYAADSKSHTEDSILLSNSCGIYSSLKGAFLQGSVRFKDLKCKELLFSILKY